MVSEGDVGTESAVALQLVMSRWWPEHGLAGQDGSSKVTGGEELK